MGSKLLWTGLMLIVTAPVLGIPVGNLVGAIIMVIGWALMMLDK